jgi:hypothetical protein
MQLTKLKLQIEEYNQNPQSIRLIFNLQQINDARAYLSLIMTYIRI